MGSTSELSLVALSAPRRRRGLISLTPLIDVVFILLIFFMLATSFFDWRALDLTPPVQAAAGPAEETAFLITLNGEGIEADGAPVEEAGLADAIAAALAIQPDRSVLIAPQAGTPLQRTVTVLDIARSAGAQSVRLVRPVDIPGFEEATPEQTESGPVNRATPNDGASDREAPG